MFTAPSSSSSSPIAFEVPAPPAAEDGGRWSATERRLISTLVVLMGVGLLLGLPFVLSAGSEFFLPVTAALVISIILSPLADVLNRWGFPNVLASLVSVLMVPVGLGLGIFLILQPSVTLFARLPALVRNMLHNLDMLRGGLRSMGRVADQLAGITGSAGHTEVVLAGPSMAQQLAFATPGALFEIVLVVLMTFFLLEARFRMRSRLLLDRTDLGASLRASRVLRDVQEQVGAYVATALSISFAVGIVVGLGAWAFGLDNPIMWGGLAAMLNLLPYFGPLVMVGLVGAYGLGTAHTLLGGLAPAITYLALHTVEANVITPMILGKRLTLSPIAILIAMTCLSWIWGVAGIFLAVPVLLIVMALMHHLGTPNFVGFLLGESLFADAEMEPASIDSHNLAVREQQSNPAA